MGAPASEESKSSLNQESSNDIGQQEYTIIHLEPCSNQLKMSKIPIDQIYREKMLSGVNFLKDYKIKTIKGTFPLGKTEQNLLLVSPKIIQIYQKNYRFLHVGLVQISVTVLKRLAPNSSLTVCLEDGRHTNPVNSILVAFESTNVSSNSLINFNLYPNVSFFLYGLRAIESLILSIQPEECDVKDGAQPFSVTYRICYKLMKTDLEPNSLTHHPKLELNTKQSTILLPVADGDGVSLERRKE